MCLCWVSTLFSIICCLSSKCNKNLTTDTWLQSLYNVLTCAHQKCSMFLGTLAHPNVMMHNVKRCILQGIYVGVQIQLKQKLFHTCMYIIFSVCDWHVKSPASVCCMYAVPNNIDKSKLEGLPSPCSLK